MTILNKKKIQLSICIPTYNRPKYLHNCLESILQSKKNIKNIGYPKNYIKVVNYAKGKFVWVIGDDEILKINCLSVFKNIIPKNNDIDFIHFNPNTLHGEYLKRFSHPFNTKNLPKKMNKFSNINKNEKIN